MWKDSIRNIVVIFQPNILRIVGFYVRHSANVYFKLSRKKNILYFYHFLFCLSGSKFST